MINESGLTGNENLRRGIIIGLGGTGGEVIQRVRRMVIDKFEKFDELPILKFLYIDTDTDWAKKGATSIVERDTSLSAAEVMDISIPDAKGLYEGIKDGNYPQYDWFCLEKLSGSTNVTKGAGTVRQLGRLCFWQHSAEIERRLRDILNSLASDQVARYMLEKYALQVDPGLDVHIVTSLAGGTGSGCFLDIAYLVRKVFKELSVAPPIEIYGYLVLPRMFADLGATNAFPNGYAALKELNYLTYLPGEGKKLAPLFGIPNWDAVYAPSGAGGVHFEAQPPFDCCYLIDVSNGKVMLSRDDVLGMLARWLFDNYSSEFASTKRSLRQNVRKPLVQNDALDCPATFMGFGQAEAWFPAREAREVLAHRLALEAIQVWLNGDDADENILRTVKPRINILELGAKFLAGVASGHGIIQTAIAIVREFIQKVLKARDILASIVSGEEFNLLEVPKQYMDTAMSEWSPGWHKKSQNLEMLESKWNEWRRDFDDTGVNPETWGMRMKWMAERKRRVFEEYRRRIEEELQIRSATSVALSLAFLKNLKDRLSEMAKNFREEAESAETIARDINDLALIEEVNNNKGDKIDKIIERRIEKEFEDVQKEKKSFLSRDAKMQTEAKEFLSWCSLWCRAKVETRRRLLSAEVCEELVNWIDSLLGIKNNAVKVLEYAGSKLSQMGKEWYQKAVSHKCLGLLLFDETILEVLEGKLRSVRGDAYKPETVGQAALRKLNLTLGELEKASPEMLADALLEAARESVGKLEERELLDTTFAAYDLLAAKFSDDELVKNLDAVAQKSTPFVPLNQNPPGGYWNPSHEYPNGLIQSRCLGIYGGYRPDDQDKERVKVLEAVARLSDPIWRVDGGDVKNLQETDRVIFAQECGGFPLRALDNIRTMKEAYDAHIAAKGAVPLHIVRDEMAAKFPDIIPPKDEQLDRAVRLTGVGMALGIIVKEDRKIPQGPPTPMQLYCFKPDSGAVEWLGDTVEAVVNRLVSEQALADSVEEEILREIQTADELGRKHLTESLSSFAEELLKGGESNGKVPSVAWAPQLAEAIRDFVRQQGLSQAAT